MRQNNPYSHITDITQLEHIEDELWAQEDELPSEAVKEDLIQLYRRMWELQPDEVRYERSIAKLLLELGRDLKRQRVNYEKARRFFEELIRMRNPQIVPIAHYRLGFIHYHNKKWDRAIIEFKKALGTLRPANRTTAEPWAELDESQKFKANVRLAMAYKHKSREIAEQAQELSERGADADPTNLFYMQELESEFLIEEQKPYVCVRALEISPMNERELRQLKDREDAVVLDYTDYDRKYLYVSGVARPIFGRNLEIMRILLQSAEPVPQWKLEHVLGIRQASVYMNRLRAFLKECGLESDAIVTDNGYKWMYPNSYMVFHRDDPEYMIWSI